MDHGAQVRPLKTEDVIGEHFWEVAEAEIAKERTEEAQWTAGLRVLFGRISDVLVSAVMTEMQTGPTFARFRWKERQRLVRLIARRAKARSRGAKA